MPGGAARVADVDVDVVLFRNLNVGAEDRKAALQDRDDHPVGILQRFAAVEGRFDLRRIFAGFDDLFDGGSDETELFGIDIHQRQRRIPEGREREDVPNQSAGETETACPDKCDLFAHDLLPVFSS